MPTVTRPAPLTLHCPNCEAAYRLDAAALGPSGRTLRCARCRTVWFAASTAEQPAPPAPALEAVGPAPVIAEPLDSPPLAADLDWRSEAEPVGSKAEDIESGLPKARPPRRGVLVVPKQKPARRGTAPLALAMLLAMAGLAGAGIVYRTEVVRAVPEMARLYEAVGLPVNVRGMVIEDLQSVEEIEAGVPVLVVSGTVTNVSQEPLDVPRLRLAVRGAEAADLYAWTALPKDRRLEPGQSTTFRARLATPPEAGTDVVVRFLNRRDMMAGLD